MPPLTVESEVQKIRNMGFQEDLDFSPKYAKTFWTNNFFTRTITRLVGKGRTKYIPIEATESGELKVAVVGGGTDVYDTFVKAAITDAVQEKVFPAVVSRVDITTWDFPVILTLSNDGTTYRANIYINADTFYSIDQSVKSIKHKNGTPGSNATLQLIGFY